MLQSVMRCGFAPLQDKDDVRDVERDIYTLKTTTLIISMPYLITCMSYLLRHTHKHTYKQVWKTWLEKKKESEKEWEREWKLDDERKTRTREDKREGEKEIKHSLLQEKQNQKTTNKPEEKFYYAVERTNKDVCRDI